MTKKFLMILGITIIGALIFAQSSKESSVEDEYLSDIDVEVVLALASSDEYDNKIYAIQMLEEAVNNGNSSSDVMRALNQLAGEGINNQARTNGRLVNNFPDIRRRACMALGKIKTEESKNYLMAITLAENEPMVIAAAVNSLGEVGLNKDDEVVNAVAFANRRNQILNPTNSLAIEVIDCYAKLYDSTENHRAVTESLTKIAADYHYNKKTREKALALLKQINESNKKNKDSSNAK